MNTYSTRPMPYGAKLRKLVRREFYLSAQDADAAVRMLQSGELRDEHGLIKYIDQHGEWLD